MPTFLELHAMQRDYTDFRVRYVDGKGGFAVDSLHSSVDAAKAECDSLRREGHKGAYVSAFCTALGYRTILWAL